MAYGLTLLDSISVERRNMYFLHSRAEDGSCSEGKCFSLRESFALHFCGGRLEMIKPSVCRKRPGVLSVFLNQPQMVRSFWCNTRKQCYMAVLPVDTSTPPRRSFFLKSSGYASIFWLHYHLNQCSSLLISLMILIKLSAISLISCLIYLYLK